MVILKADIVGRKGNLYLNFRRPFQRSLPANNIVPVYFVSVLNIHLQIHDSHNHNKASICNEAAQISCELPPIILLNDFCVKLIQ